MLSRRSFLTGLIAAPAVIRVAPLMRIAPLPLYGGSTLLGPLDAFGRALASPVIDRIYELIEWEEVTRLYEKTLPARIGGFYGLLGNPR